MHVRSNKNKKIKKQVMYTYQQFGYINMTTSKIVG